MEGGRLKINSLTAEDSGTYICSARSDFVQAETEVQLIVKTGKPITKRITHVLSLKEIPSNPWKGMKTIKIFIACFVLFLAFTVQN